MGTYLYANDGTTPPSSMTVVPVFLDDVAIDDQTTGPTLASDSDSYGNFGAPCLGALSATAVQSIVWDALSLVEMTAIRATGSGFSQHSGIGVPCGAPPPAFSATYTSHLYTSPSGEDGSWTLQQTDTASDALGATHFFTIVWAGSVQARFVKRVLTCTGSYPRITGTLEVRSQNTDFRITSTPVTVLDPPDPPDEEPDGGPVSCTLLLTWNDVEGAALYDLQRRRPSGEWDTIYTGAESEYLDTGVESGQEYYYQARAKNGDIVSEWSGTTVVESACGSDWVIPDLPAEPTTIRDCQPEARTWTRR